MKWFLAFLSFFYVVGFHDIYKGSENECTCDGLIPGQTYKVQVACSGPGGKSEVRILFKTDLNANCLTQS